MHIKQNKGTTQKIQRQVLMYWVLVIQNILITFLLCFQYFYLPGYYQALLITGLVLVTVIEVIRLYLGYLGNLNEKVTQKHILTEPQEKFSCDSMSQHLLLPAKLFIPPLK